MSLLPYEQYTIQTALSPTQVAQTLAAQVRAKSWTNRWSAGAPYEGRVESYWFEINRVLGWWTKSRPPVVAGSVRPNALGSTIEVAIRPDTAQIVGLLLVPVLFLTFSFSWGARYTLLFGAVIFLVAYAATMIGFMREVAHARRFLQAALDNAVLYTDMPVGYAPTLPTAQLSGWWPTIEPQQYSTPYGDGHDTQRLPVASETEWYNTDTRSARR
jgi:hypothetical protein